MKTGLTNNKNSSSQIKKEKIKDWKLNKNAEVIVVHCSKSIPVNEKRLFPPSWTILRL